MKDLILTPIKYAYDYYLTHAEKAKEDFTLDEVLMNNKAFNDSFAMLTMSFDMYDIEYESNKRSDYSIALENIYTLASILHRKHLTFILPIPMLKPLVSLGREFKNEEEAEDFIQRYETGAFQQGVDSK